MNTLGIAQCAFSPTARAEPAIRLKTTGSTGSPVLDASRVRFSELVTAVAMGLARVIRRWSIAALDVLRDGNGLEMFGVHTRSMRAFTAEHTVLRMAQVVDRQGSRNGMAMRQFIGNTVRHHRFAFEPELAVALIAMTAKPCPTHVRIAEENV